MIRPDPYNHRGEYKPDEIPVGVLVGIEEQGRTLCRLKERVRVFSPSCQLEISIPENYCTDWASVPTIAQIRIQPFGRWAWAALVHDWLYTVGEPNIKEIADHIFHEKMHEAHVRWYRRTSMHLAVQLFGRPESACKDYPNRFRNAQGELIDPPFKRREAFRGHEFGPKRWTP